MTYQGLPLGIPYMFQNQQQLCKSCSISVGPGMYKHYINGHSFEWSAWTNMFVVAQMANQITSQGSPSLLQQSVGDDGIAQPSILKGQCHLKS